MPSQTTYYLLDEYNLTTDKLELFESFRDAICGTGNSNITKIDNALFGIQSQLSAFPKGTIPISANRDGENTYISLGIIGITGYALGMSVLLSVDFVNTGASTLNINSLGAIDLCKVDSSGTIVDIAGNDLIPNAIYYFVYDGTRFISLSTKSLTVNVENESTDTTCFPLFSTSATGDASPKTNANFKYNAASGVLGVNNLVEGYSTTATAAGTTTLTVASNKLQYFTGSTTQTVVLPVTSTLSLGHQYKVVNNSSGNVTVNSSGGNAVQVMAGSTSAIFTCILTSGTDASSWNVEYTTSGGSGTVTDVSVATANGVSGTVANATTTPAITLSLGAITPSTVNALTLASQSVGFTVAGGTTSKTLTINNTITLAGTDSSTLNVGTGGTLGTAAYTASADYAPTAKGVTNGDSHDHNGGDGATIAYSSLSELPNNGWLPVDWANLTRTGSTTFTTTTDVTGIIQKGDKLKFTDTTTKYLNVLSLSAYSAGSMTITTIENSDYALVGNPSSMYYSKGENPQGWPPEFNFPCAWTASSVNPTLGNGTLVSRYSLIGNKIYYHVELTLGSTTNPGNGWYFFSLPVTKSTWGFCGNGYCNDVSTSNRYSFTVITEDGTNMVFVQNDTVSTSIYGYTTPFTFANGDVILFAGWYTI